MSPITSSKRNSRVGTGLSHIYNYSTSRLRYAGTTRQRQCQVYFKLVAWPRWSSFYCLCRGCLLLLRGHSYSGVGISWLQRGHFLVQVIIGLIITLCSVWLHWVLSLYFLWIIYLYFLALAELNFCIQLNIWKYFNSLLWLYIYVTFYDITLCWRL